MSGLKGSLLGVQVGGVFITCEISCDFNFSVDMIGASAIDSGRWKEYIPGIRTWSVTVNGRLLAEAAGADFKTLYKSVETGLPLYITIGTRPSATTQMTVSGTAYVASGSFSGPNKGNASWNMTIQGSGKPVTNFQDYELLIDAMPPEADYPIVVEEDPYQTT